MYNNKSLSIRPTPSVAGNSLWLGVLPAIVACMLLLGAAPDARAQAPEVFPVVQPGSNLTLAWWDVDSGADIDGSFWGPPPGLPALSYIARRGYGRPLQMLTVLPISGDPLAEPESFTQIWNDSGSGADLDGDVWRPNPPDGYTCLGEVVTRRAVPASNAVNCVRNDLVVLGSVGDLIWWDKGSGANGNFSAWDINCPAGSIDIDGFIGADNYFKPAGPVYCLAESALQPPDGPDLPAAELLLTDAFTLAWNDVDSGANEDGSFWVPDLPAEQGISALSHFGQRGYSAPISMLVARPVDTESPAFANPAGYEQVWNDSGSGASRNGAVWRAVPELGYRCLGMVVTNGTAPATDAVQCIHQSMAVPGTVGDLIWWDQGSGANNDFSSWKVDCGDDGIATDSFIGVQGYGRPTTPVYCLSKAAVTAPEAPTLPIALLAIPR